VIHAGAPIKAALNLVGQLALGLALTIGGYYLALRA
jgi:hypothetical protein